MPLRLAFCCLTACLLAACASAPPRSADAAPRRYHGTVIDAQTGAPVGDVSVTAYHLPFSVAYLLPPDYLGFTMTRADGTFDLTIPAAGQPANYLEAAANAPLADDSHPRRGEFTGCKGVLSHVSAQRSNTIRVRPLSAR